MNDHSDHPPTLEGRHIPTSSSSLLHLPPSPRGDLLTPSQLETTTNRIDPNEEDATTTTTINATTTTTTIGPTVSMSLSSRSVPSSLPLSSSLSITSSSLSCWNHPPSVSSTTITTSSTEPSSSAVALRQRHNISTTIPEHEIESPPYQQEDHRERTQPHTSSTSVVQSPPSLSNDVIDTATTTTTPTTTPSHMNHHHHSTSTHTNCTTATATDTTTTTTTTTSTTTPPTIVAIKLLISNNIAGSIIGRMGQSISELQLESQTRIKISQSSDYYPGTIDRVCLIQATSIRSVQQAVRLIVQRYYHIQQTERTSSPPPSLGTMTTHYGGTHMNHTTVFPVSVDGPVSTTTTTGTTGDGFDFVIRLLVPVTCCGMIIGKSGSNIKYMEESSGVISVRLTSKDDMVPHISNHNNNNNNQHHHPNYNNNNSRNSTGYATTSTATIMIPTNERIITITSTTVAVFPIG